MLINQLKGIECLIITEDNELLASKNLQLQYEGMMERRNE